MKTRVGIVGCGLIADLHIEAWKHLPDYAVTAVCDSNLELATAKAAKLNLPPTAVFDDYRQLHRSGLVDLVEILTPHHLHHAIAVDALQQKLHVVVQKPMAITLQEADEMIAAANSSPGILKIYENFIHYPPIVKAKQLIDEDVIGEPLSIHLKSNPGNPACGWSIPESARQWRSDASKAGGNPLTFDDGHHKIAIAHLLMGRIEQVYAQISSTKLKDGRIVDAPAMIIFNFNDNRKGVLEVVYSQDMQVQTDYYAQHDSVEVTGSASILQITQGHGQTLNQAPVLVYRDGVTTTYDDMPTDWQASFLACTQNTADALTGKSEPSLNCTDGRHVLEVVLAIHASAQSGTPIRIQQ